MNTLFFSKCITCKREFRVNATSPSCPYCGTAQKPPAAPKPTAKAPSRNKGH